MVPRVAPRPPSARERETTFATWRTRGSTIKPVKSMRRTSNCMRWQGRSELRPPMNWRGCQALTRWRSRGSRGIGFGLRQARRSVGKGHAASSSPLTGDRTLGTRIINSRTGQTRLSPTTQVGRVKAMTSIGRHLSSKITECRRILTTDTRPPIRGCSLRTRI